MSATEPKAFCPECSEATDFPLAGGYCCAECAESAGADTRHLSEKWREWESERTYRGGYEYACGYLD